MKIQQRKTQRSLKLLKKNYKISRRAYQALFIVIADSFIEYIHALGINKIQELADDLKANSWGVKSLLEVEKAYELLIVFQMFYYLNGRFPLTNSLLIIPDVEAPKGKEKINLKQVHEMFKDTNSHGLVSLQFLCALGVLFGTDKSISKSAITELYQNLSYETLSGARDFNFQAVSDLILEVNFQIKHLTLLNRKRKEEDSESNLKIKEEQFFFEQSDQFDKELVEDLFNPLQHKKIEHP